MLEVSTAQTSSATKLCELPVLCQCSPGHLCELYACLAPGILKIGRACCHMYSVTAPQPLNEIFSVLVQWAMSKLCSVSLLLGSAVWAKPSNPLTQCFFAEEIAIALPHLV